MLCCAVIFTLLTLPAIIVRRYFMPHRGNPLAWRPTTASTSCVRPEGSARRIQSFIRNRAQSFVFAGEGIRHVIRHEPASLIHGAATVVALGSAVVLDLTAQDWRWIIFAVFAVWSAEAFNTAIESTCNLLSPQFSEHVRIAKDVGAGAVLLISIGALAIGLLTFWPYLTRDSSLAPDRPRPTAALCLDPMPSSVGPARAWIGGSRQH
jgi:diacylglycerol kinase (ATP)